MNNIIFKINFYIILFVIFGKIFSNSNDTSILDFDITTYESYPFKEKYLKFKPSFNFDGKLSNHKNTEYPLDKNFMNDGLVSLLLFRKSWEDTEFKQKESWWDVTASYDYERNKYNRKIYYDYFQLTEIFGEKSKKNFNLDCYYRNSIRKYTQRRNFFELYIRTFFVADIPYIEEGISERTSENYYDSAYYYFDRHYSRTKYYRFILFPDLIFYFGKGRIRDVTYPSVVMHIMNDFKDRSLLKSKPNSSDILKMSQLFEKLKQKRSFDSRGKRIDDIKDIHAFLLSENLIDSISPESVMRLLDFWEYSFNQKRYNGFRNGVGIEVSGNYDFNISSGKSYRLDTLIAYTDKDFKKNIETIINDLDSSSYTNYSNRYDDDGGGLEYALSYYLLYQRPNNLIGQFSAYIDVNAGINQDISNRNTTNTLLGKFYSKFIYYWYTSIRTTISISTEFAFNKYYWNFNIPGHEDYKRNNNELKVGIGSEFDYYVNPRLDFKFSGNMSYNRWRDLYDENSGDNDFDYSLSFNMVYEIY